MNTRTGFELPAPLGSMLARLPALPGSMLLAAALSRGLAPQLPADVLAALRHRRLRIEVRDARLAFDVTWNGWCFAGCAAQQGAELTLNASAHDFLRMAQRQEDPDTLFFNRRLKLQGDTELGLIVKNALDALEQPLLDIGHWAPPPLLALLAPRRRVS